MNKKEFNQLRNIVMTRLRPITFPAVILRNHLRFLRAKYLCEHNPEKLVRRIYERSLERKLNLENPMDLNEKISWLKLFSDTTSWSDLSDKYNVREFIIGNGLEDMLVKLYGAWDNAEHIDFDKLPNSFVLKTSNASGTVIIVEDKSKLNIKKTRRKLNNWLNNWSKIAIQAGEFHYLPIKPRIIAEEFLADTENNFSSTLIDYKIWCLSGEPYSVWTCYNRINKYTYVALHELDWTYHPEHSVFTDHYRQGERLVPKPRSLDKMISACKLLAKGFPQVRIDFYEVNGKPYFGEMTFTSLGGRMDFYTQEYLLEMGEKVILPNNKTTNKFMIH